ncbi:hypothetical protein GOBAR_DD07354 [Gossypium barbadense]|nr:hypothetical protein GOBAR_DD07354 [Gossypium barbadense]
MGFNQLADKEKEVLVIAYWVIWHSWNRLVHDDRNENGEILAACTYPHFGVADAFIAEAHVCEQTMTFAQELGSANTTAHVLARSGCRLPAPQYWIEEAPLEYLSLQKVPQARFSCVSSLIFHAGPRWGRVYKKIVQILASFVTYS